MKTIRELRRERGWTQFDLALAVGVQPQTVYLWESGRRQPQVSQMRRLGRIFGLCSDEIDLEPARDQYHTLPGPAPADELPENRHGADLPATLGLRASATVDPGRTEG